MNILKRAASALAVPAGVLIAAILVTVAIIAAVGGDPVHSLREVIMGCFGSPYGFGQILYKTTSLAFTGLAVAVAFRAGLFNIGVEGQLYIGSFAGALVALYLHNLPAVILLPLVILTAALVGALWAAIPGALKVLFGAHEVITTIMLNFISLSLVGWLLGFFAANATVHTEETPAGIWLPRLSKFIPAMHGTWANLSILIAIAAAGVVWFLFSRTSIGYELRAIGLNPDAAETAGIPKGRTIVLAMALSGAVAGLTVSNEILGGSHYFERDFPSGIGYLGIAVALLARNNPWAVILTAFLFSVISYAGLVIQSASTPRELADVIAALIILLTICGMKLREQLMLRSRKKALARASA
ncbi:ABC transporter permease [soil metagenome]